MSGVSALLVPDVWPELRRKIEEERDRCLESLVSIGTVDELRRLQGFIQALDWVVDEARPKPQPEEEDE